MKDNEPLLTLYLIELEKVTSLSAVLLENPDNSRDVIPLEIIASMSRAQTQLQALLSSRTTTQEGGKAALLK